MNVVVRPAEASDADRLTTIAHAAKRHWGYSDEDVRSWRRDLTILPQFIRDHAVWCAGCAGEVVGFCAVTATNGWELDHLWVDPDHHGRGVGTMLLRHAVDGASVAGATVLRITSDPNAVGFYEKRAARQVGSMASSIPGRELPLMELHVGRG